MKIQVVVQGNTTRGLLLIALAAVLWGTVGVAVKAVYVLADTNALSIGFLRLAIALPALLWLSWFVLGTRMFRVARLDLVLMMLIGVMMALYQVCYFGAIARVGVAITVLVALCTAPVLVAVLSLWLFGEKLTSWLVLALALALVGTILLVGVPVNTTGEQGNAIIGVALAFGSAFGYAVITLCSRALRRCHPLQSLTIGLGTGALVLLPFALSHNFAISYSLSAWALLWYLGLVPTVLAYVLFLKGIRHATATAASITTLLEPLTSTLLAGLFFNEQLGVFGLLGGMLLFVAIVLLFRSGFQQG